MFIQLHATAALRFLLTFDITKGFSIVRQDLKSSRNEEVFLEPAALDALVQAWPEFKAKANNDVPVKPVAPATPSRPENRDGPALTSSPSPSPSTTASGGGDRRWNPERAKPAASSPGAQKTLL